MEVGVGIWVASGHVAFRAGTWQGIVIHMKRWFVVQVGRLSGGC